MQAGIGSQKKTVLVIDDYRSLREGLQLLLADDYTVVAVESGERAVELVQQVGPDLILLDLKLPGISGEEVLLQLRLHQIHSPVLIISAIQDPSVVANLFRMGARDYLTKPFNIRELKGKMEEIFLAASRASQG